MSDDQQLLEEITEELLSEIKRTTTSRVTSQTKIKRATSQLSSVEARKKHDPLYQQMIKYRDLYFKYRELVHKKYSSRVRSRARR
jgi:hypothetical protein